jgi:hypothetical protein
VRKRRTGCHEKIIVRNAARNPPIFSAGRSVETQEFVFCGHEEQVRAVLKNIGPCSRADSVLPSQFAGVVLECVKVSAAVSR